MSAPAPKLSVFRQRLRSTFAQSPSSAVLNHGNVSLPADPTLVDTVVADQTAPVMPLVDAPAPATSSDSVLATAQSVATQPAEPASPSDDTLSTAPEEMTTDQKLDVLESIISKLEDAAPTPETIADATLATGVEPVPPGAQAVPVESPVAATPAQAVPVEPPVVISPPPVHVSSLSKETVPGAFPDQQVVDSGSGVQVVEYEPHSELPVEVESYIQEIQDHQTEQPQEIIITDGQMQIQPAAVPKKSVIVLPITPETEAEGARKSPKWSIRWLVEWSRKLMKTFSGRIIYREVSAEN